MREPPPHTLVAMLERLGLAAAGQVQRASGRVRRLARDLPLFESVWIDALVQARVLTPYQAGEINDGRAELLRAGPYVIERPMPWPAYTRAYRAREVRTGEPVHLVLMARHGGPSSDILGRLEALAAKADSLAAEGLAPIASAGGDDQRRWAAAPWVEGRTAAEWVVRHGRFPPEVVLEIARQMLAALTALENADVVHGDVGVHGLVLTADGRAMLTHAGLRAIVRPEEGYAYADLSPEAYDALAPERIAAGVPPTIASDIYACGCTWWHLLAGRPPLGGGNSLGKLQSAHAARTADVRRLVPEAPAELAAAVTACLAADPRRRPESMARLAAMLGPPTRAGRASLVRCLARAGRPVVGWIQPSSRSVRRPSRGPWWLVVATSLLVALGALVSHRAGAGGRLSDTVENRSSAATENKVGQVAQSTPADRTGAGVNAPVAAERQGGPAVQGAPRSAVVAARYEREEPDELVLPAGQRFAGEGLRLRAGLRVRGMPGQRPTIVVPPTGLVVAVDGVRFENIEFRSQVPAPADAPLADPLEAPALIVLRSGSAEFRGCVFQVERAGSALPAAIRWTHPCERSEARLALPSGRVQLSNCVIRGTGMGIDCRTAAAIGLELVNTLALISGPMLRLDHFPAQDEPVVVSLSRVTLRDAASLMECRYGRIDGQPGAVSIHAKECALAPAPGGAVLLLVGADPPERLLENMRWTGQGSLVIPAALVAGWMSGPGSVIRPLDDTAVAIAGLVRSEVGFAGRAEADPAASRILRWQGPLRSPDPPGIDPELLGVAP